MAPSLGLQAYKALARRSETPQPAPDVPRPQGELVWLHAGEAGNSLAVQDLAHRLVANREDTHALITYAEGDAPPALAKQGNGRVLQAIVPGEHPQSVKTALQHWQPDACIWIWGGLRPSLLMQMAEQDCPLFLIDADAKGFDGRRDRWLPDLTRRVLSQFEVVLARTETARRRISNITKAQIEAEVTSQLLAGGQPLTCADQDLADLSAALGGRPVWCATNVFPKEVPIVLAAHAQALRLSHRLLLVILPASQAQAPSILSAAQARDMITLNWGDGLYPDDQTQVLVADDPADTGLFYRIAPVSFLGGSLVAGAGGPDPLNAASLGSAVLYGPKVRHFLPSYSRLAAAGAARIVNDVDALGNAVSRLVAPDQAATMAHAGWDVISEGAALTDKVIDMVQDALDARGSIG